MKAEIKKIKAVEGVEGAKDVLITGVRLRSSILGEPKESNGKWQYAVRIELDPEKNKHEAKVLEQLKAFEEEVLQGKKPSPAAFTPISNASVKNDDGEFEDHPTAFIFRAKSESKSSEALREPIVINGEIASGEQIVEINDRRLNRDSVIELLVRIIPNDYKTKKGLLVRGMKSELLAVGVLERAESNGPKFTFNAADWK